MLWWVLNYLRLTFQLSEHHRVPLTASLSYAKISALYRKMKILNSISKAEKQIEITTTGLYFFFNHIYHGQPQWLFHIIGFPVFPSQEHPELCLENPGNDFVY